MNLESYFCFLRHKGVLLGTYYALRSGYLWYCPGYLCSASSLKYHSLLNLPRAVRHWDNPDNLGPNQGPDPLGPTGGEFPH
jgi:hypothetical protein